MRVTPERTTAVFRGAAGAVLFVKVRRRRRADAVREWHSWMTLQELGVAGPVGIAWGWDGSESVVVARRVSGRPADVLWHEAVLRGDVAGAMACLVPVGRVVQRLHAAGVVYRDLYWQHVYGDHLSPSMRPAFIDSERLTAVGRFWWPPRARGRDYAGLLSSLPSSVDRRKALELLLADSSGGPSLPRSSWILAKAAAIRGRQPRFG